MDNSDISLRTVRGHLKKFIRNLITGEFQNMDYE